MRKHWQGFAASRGGRALVLGASLAGRLAASHGDAHAAGPETIQRLKPSIVAVGTVQKTRSPQFTFLATGFAVGSGSFVATNAHALPVVLNSERNESLVVAIPHGGTDAELRPAETVAVNKAYDVALIKIQGAPLPPVTLGDSSRVREGQTYLFTGYPLGTALGLFPAAHRAMVSALTPIALPTAHASQLDARTIRRLAAGAYPVFQLDATAYPGNSGSPLYDPETGAAVAIINMAFVKSTKESALSEPSGITYAIPIQALTDLLRAVQ